MTTSRRLCSPYSLFAPACAMETCNSQGSLAPLSGSCLQKPGERQQARARVNKADCGRQQLASPVPRAQLAFFLPRRPAFLVAPPPLYHTICSASTAFSKVPAAEWARARFQLAA